MGRINSFDIVKMVTDEASKQFGRAWTVNKDKESELNDACKRIDEFAERIDAETIEVEVDDISMDIIISVCCSDLIVDEKDDVFYDIAKKSKAMFFRCGELKDTLDVGFIFSKIWERYHG